MMIPAVLLWCVGCGGKSAKEGTAATKAQTPILRVVTISPNAARIIHALGEEDRIVGVSKFCSGLPSLKDRPRVGGLFDPDLERIAALKPDLVVLRGQNRDIRKLCEQYGIRLYKDPTESLADIETCAKDLAGMLDCEERGEKLIVDFQNRMKKVRLRTENLKKTRVLVTVARNPESLANILTVGQDTFLGAAITIAGGVNPFEEIGVDYPTVSTEAILAAQPEVIIEFIPEVEDAKHWQREMKKQWRELGSTPALANNRIHIVISDNALTPSLAFVEVIEQMAKLLHPNDLD